MLASFRLTTFSLIWNPEGDFSVQVGVIITSKQCESYLTVHPEAQITHADASSHQGQCIVSMSPHEIPSTHVVQVSNRTTPLTPTAQLTARAAPTQNMGRYWSMGVDAVAKGLGMTKDHLARARAPHHGSSPS
jgi:hypothetical protein